MVKVDVVKGAQFSDDRKYRYQLWRTLYAPYPGWNFFGKVWSHDNRWACEVWVYGSHRETFIADTPEELMETISSQYGYQ